MEINQCLTSMFVTLQVLLLLINLVQNNENNTQRFLSVSIPVDDDNEVRSISALDLIVDLFYKREELAR